MQFLLVVCLLAVWALPGAFAWLSGGANTALTCRYCASPGAPAAIVQRRRTLQRRVELRLAARRSSDDVQDRLQSAEMLAVFPIDALKLDQISSLKKALVGNPYATVLSNSKLRSLVDKSPFCLVADHITSQSFCVFVESQVTENFEAICGWIKSVAKKDLGNSIDHFQLLLCKKGHMLRIRTEDLVV
ncbi:hypothetical protein B484DRAFT_455861 [Ochromonadaceae sp. CCMP2298]|nr:hypothetical protein B484DRAFT_455861 [Ochromonadaceae sp. CCMP2298]